MADALRLAPILLIAVAVDAAAAQPMGPLAGPQLADKARIDRPAWQWRDPVQERQLFLEESESLPAWTLPFGAGAGEPGRGRVTISVRPGRGLKAIAKIRF